LEAARLISLEEDKNLAFLQTRLIFDRCCTKANIGSIFNHVQGFPEVDKLAILRITHHISLIKGEINKHLSGI
jgi:hypothetical protein